MPSSQGHHNQQRRIFRGKGGATDGRLPPKKNRRVKVKYQPTDSGEAEINGNGHNQDQLSIDEELSDRDFDDVNEYQSEIKQDDVIVEINHVQKRIHNIQTSLQTSRGLSNPQTWYNNCLVPVKNAIKEWRSICNFHSLTAEILPSDDGGDVQTTASECNPHRDKIHETSVQVFNLLQMAMQSGPLVGSNPGYFKRCGGEVASTALGFLYEILDLIGVSETREEDVLNSKAIDGNGNNANCDRNDDTADNDSSNHAVDELESMVDTDLKIASSSSSDSDDSSQSNSRNSSNSIIDNGQFNVYAAITYANDTSNNLQTQIVQEFQTSLLFSETQAQRISQWIHNAEKAAEANKAPSKSSQKLQSQKSKKQQMKELKMERKLKKKKRSGGK